MLLWLLLAVCCHALQQLTVFTGHGSGTNHFLQLADGTPFYYVADTAWQMMQRANITEVTEYVHQRKAHMFNTVQTTAVWDPSPNVNGDTAFHPPTDPTLPNEPYWKHIDDIVNLTSHLGLYVALWPVWGSMMISDGGSKLPTPIFTTADQGYQFGKFIGTRYKGYSHLIWVLGGDISIPVTPADRVGVYRAMAEGIAQGFTGLPRPQWNNTTNPAWQKLLMSLHPTSPHSSSEQFQQDAWLSFNMIQSGWGHQADIVPLTEKDWSLKPTRPTFMGEGAYERDRYTFCGQPGTNGAWGVRMNAWWGWLSGGFGITYGANGLWDWREVPNHNHKPFPQYSWREALQFPGGGQFTHLMWMLNRMEFTQLQPDTGYLVVPKNQTHSAGDCTLVIAGLEVDRPNGGHSAVIYNTMGVPMTIKLTWFDRTATATWIDPRNGSLHDAGTIHRATSETFVPPGQPGVGNDWVLFIGG